MKTLQRKLRKHFPTYLWGFITCFIPGATFAGECSCQFLDQQYKLIYTNQRTGKETLLNYSPTLKGCSHFKEKNKLCPKNRLDALEPDKMGLGLGSELHPQS